MVRRGESKVDVLSERRVPRTVAVVAAQQLAHDEPSGRWWLRTGGSTLLPFTERRSKARGTILCF